MGVDEVFKFKIRVKGVMWMDVVLGNYIYLSEGLGRVFVVCFLSLYGGIVIFYFL